MKITTKTSPQGVEIEYIEYQRAESERALYHARVMNRIRIEKLNRRDAEEKQRLAEVGVR